MSFLTEQERKEIRAFHTGRKPRIVSLEAEASFTETRPGSSLYHAKVYRLDDDGQRRLFAEAYGDTAEDALTYAEGIARALNERFAGR